MTNPHISAQLKQLPYRPGVYLFKDDEGNILYVGKATKLRNQVRSYFAPTSRGGKLTAKLKLLVSHVRDIEFFVTNSEQEALILELNLIKRYRPHYNVRLKDDKTFPFLKITLNEDWPRIYFTRRLTDDGSRYFGPFTNSHSVRETLKVLKRIFPFRTCSQPIFRAGSRACLEYHIGRCNGPCVGAVNREEYAKIIKQVILFLNGKQDAVLKQLQSKMEGAAEALDFERAAAIRDQIQAIEQVIEGQKIAFPVSGEQDVIAFAAENDIAAVQVFFIRAGRIIGRESFTLQGVSSEEPSQIMSSFIRQFYSTATHVPPLVLLQHPVEDKCTIEEWLRSKNTRVRFLVPLRGKKKQLVEIVAANAAQSIQQLKLSQPPAAADFTATLAEIQKELHLPHLPERMECYDISNIQGKMAVGSMVVFEKGRPKPAHYRRFRIKTVAGADDYAMLGEVLKRRFKRSQDSKTTGTWTITPDLVLIDGGKGQLNAARSAMEVAEAGMIPVAGLAKENEAVFIPSQAAPIALPASSPARQMLQRLRDEAHRFALSYHHNIRHKEAFASVLDTIPGIGPKRKRSLLREFGSVRAIFEATASELAAAEGMNSKLAALIAENRNLL